MLCLAFVLQWNLSNGTLANQGTLPFRGQKIWSRKNVRIIFVSVTSTEGAPLFRRKGHFKLRFSLYSGDILAFKTWPTTNRVDTSKSTLITISLKSTFCTCGNSTHNIAEISWSWLFFALCSCFACSRFWGRIKNIYCIYSINRPRRLLNFWTLRVGAYSRWALIRGWALIKFSSFWASVVCLFCNKTIMVITKREDVTKQSFCKLPFLWRKLRLRGSLFILVLIQFQPHCHQSGWGGGGRLFEAERLLTFSAFRMGAYSRLGAYSNKYRISFVC